MVQLRSLSSGGHSIILLVVSEVFTVQRIEVDKTILPKGIVKSV